MSLSPNESADNEINYIEVNEDEDEEFVCAYEGANTGELDNAINALLDME